VAEAEPADYVAPEPQPVQVLAQAVVAEAVVAESVVAEAEPEQTIAPGAERGPETLVEPSAVVDPRPQPQPVVVVEPEPEPMPAAVVEPEPVAVEPELVARTEPEDETPEEPRSRLSLLLRNRRQPRPEPDPEPTAATEPEPEPVVAVDPEPEPEPVAVAVVEPAAVEPELVARTEPEGAPPAEPAPSRSSFLSRASRQPKPARQRRSTASPSTGDAARDLVAAKAKARARAKGPAPEPAVVVEPAAAVVEPPAKPEVAPAPKKESKHEQVAGEMPGRYLFRPRKTSRRLLTIAMLAGLVASAYFVKAAFDSQDTASMGLAAIVVLAAAMVWAIRAGAAPTKLEVHQGQLEVVRQGDRFVFDLASPYTHVEVRGRPGRRGWKVLFPRRGMAPFAVDSTMVDADDFMRVLRFFRPELVSH